jgi:hypothetical protein
MTDRRPALLPAPTGDNGIRLDYSAWATASLLSDLRSDRGMEWVPSSAWLSKVVVDSSAAGLSYDLAIDASGANAPSRVAAGLALPAVDDVVQTVQSAASGVDVGRLLLAVMFSVVGIFGIFLITRYRPGETR